MKPSRKYQVFLLGNELQNDKELLNSLRKIGVSVGVIDALTFGETVLIAPNGALGSGGLPSSNTPMGKRLPPSAFDALAHRYATPLFMTNITKRTSIAKPLHLLDETTLNDPINGPTLSGQHTNLKESSTPIVSPNARVTGAADTANQKSLSPSPFSSLLRRKRNSSLITLNDKSSSPPVDPGIGKKAISSDYVTNNKFDNLSYLNNSNSLVNSDQVTPLPSYQDMIKMTSAPVTQSQQPKHIDYNTHLKGLRRFSTSRLPPLFHNIFAPNPTTNNSNFSQVGTLFPLQSAESSPTTNFNVATSSDLLLKISSPYNPPTITTFAQSPMQDSSSHKPKSSLSFDESSMMDLSSGPTHISLDKYSNKHVANSDAVSNIESQISTYFDIHNPFYVISDFSGNFFDKLQREKFGRRLVGPPFMHKISGIIADSNPDFPEVRHPIFCLNMRGLNICFSRFTDTLKLTNLVCLSQYMGATVRKKFNGAKVTHLVSFTAQGDKYRAASNLGKPIMSQDWILHCWEHRFDSNFNPVNESVIAQFKLKPFVGCTISFIGFSTEENLHMEEQALIYGAKIGDCEDPGTTHIVVDALNVKVENLNLAACDKHNVLLVKAEWFWVSIQLDFCADEKLYLFMPPQPDNIPYPNLNTLTRQETASETNTPSSISNQSYVNSNGILFNYTSNGNNSIVNNHHTPLNLKNMSYDSNSANSYSNNFRNRSKTYNKDKSGISKSLFTSAGDQLILSHALGKIGENEKSQDISADLSSILNYNQCQSARQMTAVEILNTERNYVNCLEIIRNVYHKPLEDYKYTFNNLNSGHQFGSVNSRSNLLQNMHASASFDITDLYNPALSKSTKGLSSYGNTNNNKNNTLTTIHQINSDDHLWLGNNQNSSLDTSGTTLDQFSNISNKSTPLLDPTEIKAIFGNLPPIYEVHKRMLIDLCKLMQNYTEECSIGNVILAHVDGMLKAYPPFINFFHDSQKTLKNCDQTKPKFHAFLKICQTRPECGRQGLEDLLIRPVQRLPSLILLLSDLLKHTPDNVDDRHALTEAINAVKNVLDQINEGKRKTETQLHMFEIVNDIENCPPNLLSSQRTFIAKAYVHGLTNETNTKGRHLALFLFNDCLEICKRKNIPSSFNKLATNFNFLSSSTTTSNFIQQTPKLSSGDSSYPKFGPGPGATLNRGSSKTLGIDLDSRISSPTQQHSENNPRHLVKSASTLTKMVGASSSTRLPSISSSTNNNSIFRNTEKSMSHFGSTPLDTNSSINRSANANSSSNASTSSAALTSNGSWRTGTKNFKHVELLNLSHIKIIGDIIDHDEFYNAFAIICSNNASVNDSTDPMGDTSPQFTSEGRLLLFALEDDEKVMTKARLLEALHKNTVNTLCLSDGRSILRPIHPDEMVISPSGPNNGTISKALRTAKKLLSRKMSRAFSFNKSTPFKLKRTVSTISTLTSETSNSQSNQHHLIRTENGENFVNEPRYIIPNPKLPLHNNSNNNSSNSDIDQIRNRHFSISTQFDWPVPGTGHQIRQMSYTPGLAPKFYQNQSHHNCGNCNNNNGNQNKHQSIINNYNYDTANSDNNVFENNNIKNDNNQKYCHMSTIDLQPPYPFHPTSNVPGLNSRPEIYTSIDSVSVRSTNPHSLTHSSCDLAMPQHSTVLTGQNTPLISGPNSFLQGVSSQNPFTNGPKPMDYLTPTNPFNNESVVTGLDDCKKIYQNEDNIHIQESTLVDKL